jgi:hypothetical protein
MLMLCMVVKRGLASTSPDFDVPPDAQRPILQLKPHDLLGALYFQLARHIAEEKRLQRCANPKCGRWFALGPGADYIASKLTCSGSCRTILYRYRKRARAMKALGWSPTDIANELGTNVKTVQRWISKK